MDEQAGKYTFLGMVQKLKERLEGITAEGSAGGGMVKAVVNGKKELVRITIDPQVVDPKDVEMLQDLIIAAVAAANRNLEEQMKETIAESIGDLGINLEF